MLVPYGKEDDAQVFEHVCLTGWLKFDITGG